MSVLRSWTEHRALRAARRRADEQLLESLLPSPRLAWRIAELTSPEHREALARALTDVVHAADERFLPGAKPLNRGAVRTVRAQLLELAVRLFDGERAAPPRAVLLVERLLVDGGGPLYGDDSVETLRREIERIDEALGS